MSWLPSLIAAVPLLLALGGGVAWLYRIREQQKRAPDEQLNAAIEQWKKILGGSVDELREQNAYQTKLIDKQREQIEKLEAEVETLEGIIRDLTQQNLNAGQREKRMADKYEALMTEHGKVLRRLEEQREKGEHDAA